MRKIPKGMEAIAEQEMKAISDRIKAALAKTIKTPVTFKMEDGRPIAVFYKEQGTTDPDTRTCYTSQTQHSYGTRQYFNRLKRATPEQYGDLKQELESIGYNLLVKGEAADANN